MANGNGNFFVWVGRVTAVLVLLGIIVGAALTFANKVNKSDMDTCALALERKIENGDAVLHKRVDKTEETIIRLEEKILNRMDIMNKEIVDILKTKQ